MTDHEADLISIAASYLPEGYVLVPVEPTYEMQEAGYDKFMDSCNRVYEIYTAMIQAAQGE